MKTKLRIGIVLACVAILAVAAVCIAADHPADTTSTPPVLTAMQEELDRSIAGLSKADPPDYFISYTVADRQFSEVSGSNGALLSSGETRARWLEVQTRVGTYQRDDTHKLADRQPSWTSPGTSATVDDE